MYTVPPSVERTFKVRLRPSDYTVDPVDIIAYARVNDIIVHDETLRQIAFDTTFPHLEEPFVSMILPDVPRLIPEQSGTPPKGFSWAHIKEMIAIPVRMRESDAQRSLLSGGVTILSPHESAPERSLMLTCLGGRVILSLTDRRFPAPQRTYLAAGRRK